MLIPTGVQFTLPDRIGTGSASAYGGIKGKDAVPSSAPWDLNSAPTRPSKARTFTPLPMLLWEWSGDPTTLAGILVVSPSVWEFDTGSPVDPAWGNAEAKAVADIATSVAAAGGALATAFPILAPAAAVGAAIAGLAQLLPAAVSGIKDIIGVAGDRPIGQEKSGSTRTYDPKILTIDLANLATAAAFIGANDRHLPGVYRLSEQDGSNLGGGKYDMYVKVTYQVV